MTKSVNIKLVKRYLLKPELVWLKKLKPTINWKEKKTRVAITLDLVLYDPHLNTMKSRDYYKNKQIRLPDIFIQSNFVLYASYKDKDNFEIVIELKKNDLFSAPVSLYDIKHILTNIPDYTKEFKQLLVDINPENINFFKKK